MGPVANRPASSLSEDPGGRRVRFPGSRKKTKNGRNGMLHVTRRRFLQSAAVFSLSMGLPGRGFAAGPPGPKERPRVVEVTGPLEESLEMLIRTLGGMERFVRRGGTVLIKPNMSFPNPPDLATTTDPRLVRGVVRRCLEAGAKEVVVADHPMRAVSLCLEMTGMKTACRELRDVHLIGASREGMYQEVPLPDGRALTRSKVLRIALKADVLINLPRMKSHAATTVSMGTKGNMGLIWDRASFHSRMDLNEAIGDLNTLIRADLTILDGTRALTAGGPLGPGPVAELNCLIGGVDPVAVDALGVRKVDWYGKPVRPEQVAHLMACHRRGVGEIDLDRIDIVKREV